MNTFILLLILTFTLNAWAGPKDLLCTYRNAKIVIPVVKKHSSYDKNMHCSVSCMLSNRCNSTEVMFAGLFKELQDMTGPGDADPEDLVADKYGVDLVKSGRSMNDRECLEQCDLQYPSIKY